MAGDWIKVELELPDKPEVHYISNILGIDPDATIGKLIRVWGWFDKHTEDGNALGVTFALLDRITGVSGFGEAMQLAGWLVQKDAVLTMPNFDRHTSKSAKARATTGSRVKRHRNAATVTKALPEKRREENINTSVSHEKIVFDGSRFKGINGFHAKWVETYSGVDVDNEIAKAEAWAIANPERAKKNWARFLTNWLSNAQKNPGQKAADWRTQGEWA